MKDYIVSEIKKLNSKKKFAKVPQFYEGKIKAFLEILNLIEEKKSQVVIEQIDKLLLQEDKDIIKNFKNIEKLKTENKKLKAEVKKLKELIVFQSKEAFD